MSGMTVVGLDELVPDALRRLTDAAVPSPRADLELLIAHVLGLSRGQAAAAAVAGRKLSVHEADSLGDLIEERVRRVPLQHLTGLAPFRGLQLRVGPGVFVPRPETEQVAQVALDRIAQLSIERPRVLDLGTGSGALAAAIAAEDPKTEVHAVEVSAHAAAWARLNLDPLGVTVHLTDLRDLPGDWQGTFDVVVSNPPYIPAGMVPQDPEVREHDPAQALYGGGEDGIELPRSVVTAAEAVLVRGGWLILEHAEVQAEAIAAELRGASAWEQVRTHQDLSGRDRATSARVSGAQAAASPAPAIPNPETPNPETPTMGE